MVLYYIAISISFIPLIERGSHPDLISYLNIYTSFNNGEVLPLTYASLKLYYVLNNTFTQQENFSIPIVYSLNIILCGILLFYLVIKNKVYSLGLVLYLSTFAFLFFLVLLRAGPAYLLSCIAILELNKSYKNSLIFATIACFFHVTALIVLVAIIVCSFGVTRKIPLQVIFTTSILIYCFTLVQLPFLSFFMKKLITLISVGDYSKYLIYADYSGRPSMAHIIYVLSLFILFIFFIRDKRIAITQKYVICTILILVAIFSGNPVIGFRIGLYAIGPMLLLFPFNWFRPLSETLILPVAGLLMLFNVWVLLPATVKFG